MPAAEYATNSEIWKLWQDSPVEITAIILVEDLALAEKMTNLGARKTQIPPNLAKYCLLNLQHKI